MPVLVWLVSAYEQILVLHDFDFQPIACPLTNMISAVFFLSDDPFQPFALDELKERIPLLFDIP